MIEKWLFNAVYGFLSVIIDIILVYICICLFYWLKC